MARFIIKSRKGEQVFTCPDHGEYVRLNGAQICKGGHITGPTLACTSDELPAVARGWWAQALRHQRAR